jgi:hypothetical protein
MNATLVSSPISQPTPSAGTNLRQIKIMAYPPIHNVADAIRNENKYHGVTSLYLPPADVDRAVVYNPGP